MNNEFEIGSFVKGKGFFGMVEETHNSNSVLVRIYNGIKWCSYPRNPEKLKIISKSEFEIFCNRKGITSTP